MSLLSTYWCQRSRHKLFSREWAVAWAKRLLLLRPLLEADWRRYKLLRGGASIGSMTCISPASFDGPLTNLSIGSHSFVGRATIQLHCAVKIGDNVCINDGVHIFSASHDVRDPMWSQISLPVVIEDYAWIASSAILLPGVTIGRGAVVGAGAVVSRDVPAAAVATGNPADIRENIRCLNLQYSPEEFLATRRAWI